DGELCTFSCKQQCRRLANAGCPPRDQCNLVIQTHVASLPADDNSTSSRARTMLPRPWKGGLQGRAKRSNPRAVCPVVVFHFQRLPNPPPLSPPSSVNTCPVAKVASSDARYANSAAISSGEACLRIGILPFTSASIASEYSARCMGVRTYPGATAQTRTLGASPSAIDFVNSITPALVAL